MSVYLEVDGLPVNDFHRFSVRWALADKGPVAVLYHDGKRVTRPWRLLADENNPADPHGGNANTE